jgi:hypothetical protein
MGTGLKGDGELNSQLDWVASYPKSGNTWIRLLLASYQRAQLLHYHDVSRYMFQCVSPHPLHELSLLQQVQIRNAAVLHIACACAADVPAIVKTHHANVDVMGMQLFAQAFVRKAIYIMRDPRDLVMSMAHHFDMTPEQAVKLLADPLGIIRPTTDNMTYILGTWSEHVISWITGRFDLPVLVTSYERMHADTAGVLREVVKFLEWPVNEKRIQEAVEENQFKTLQAEEKEHGFSEQAAGRQFFRRGEAGSWRDELDLDLARQIERDHGEVMRRVGYKPESRIKVVR